MDVPNAHNHVGWVNGVGACLSGRGEQVVLWLETALESEMTDAKELIRSM